MLIGAVNQIRSLWFLLLFKLPCWKVSFNARIQCIYMFRLVYSQEMFSYMRNVKIDDNRIVCGDHISIFIDLDLKISEPKVKQKNGTWKYNHDGLHKFKSLTESGMPLDSLSRCHSNKTGYIEFYQWEKALQSFLYQYLTRVHRRATRNFLEQRRFLRIRALR